MGTASRRRGIAERAVKPQFEEARKRLSTQRAEVTRQQALLQEQQARLRSQEFIRGTTPQMRQQFSQRLSEGRQQLSDFSSRLSQAGTVLNVQEKDVINRVLRDIVKAQSFSAEQAIASAESSVGRTLSSQERDEIVDRVIAEAQLDIPRFAGGEDPLTITSRASTEEGLSFSPGRNQFQSLAVQTFGSPTITPTFRERVSEVTGGRISIPESRAEARERLVSGGRDIIGFVGGGTPGDRPFGLPESVFEFPAQDPTSLPARVRTPVVEGVSFVSQVLGASPRTGRVIGETALFAGLIPLGLPGTARQVTVRKTFSEAAREALAGLRNQFQRARLGGETGRLAEIGFKNNVRVALQGRSPEEIKAFRELVRLNLGDDAARLVDDALIEQLTFVRPPREIVRPGQPAQLPVISPQLGGVFQDRGAFAGRGQFERTGEVAFITPLGRQLSLRNTVITPELRTQSLSLQPQTRTFGIFSQLSLQQQQDIQLQRLAQQQRLQQRQFQRARLGLGLATGVAQQPVQAQAQAQPQLQIPRPRIPRPQIPGEGLPGTRVKVPPPLLPGVSASFKKKLAKLKKQAKAFDVLVKRRDKWEKVGNDLPFGMALKKGADITKDTLAAQFRVVPDKGKKPKGKDIKFRPSPDTFRDFQIKRGVATALPIGHFIERRNKRITSGGEISEILRAQRGKRERKRRIKLF